jgi:two-component system, LytTR family, sensor kinase
MRVWKLLLPILGLALFSGAMYGFIYIVRNFGDVTFYSVTEHAMEFAYGTSSLLAIHLSFAYLSTEKHGSWPQYWRPFLVSCLLSSLFCSAIFIIVRWIEEEPVSWFGVLINIPINLLTLHFVIAGVYVARHYMHQRNREERARLEAERASSKMAMKLLLQQVDPHFLFNNLNALGALIRKDPASAEDYVQHLASLYRHLLRHRESEWVTLDEELAFAHSYMKLMQMRFGAAFVLRVDSDVPLHSELFVIPGVLQELIGNAIKHNHGNESEPMIIDVHVDESELRVTNPYRPRQSHQSETAVGLANICSRYRLQAKREPLVERTGDIFRVRVPLLREALSA